MEKIKGVNLGGWLVLEKWMVPHLFKDLPLENEGMLTLRPHEIQLSQRLHQHYDSFICERDFKKIKAMGLNLVRIPVPHTMFEKESFVQEYLDRAFQWARNNHLKILIDLHTVPGGQNGFDNSCNYQKITWDQCDQNILESIEVIKKIIDKYGSDEALYGIEPVNEPLNATMFQHFKIQYTSDSKPIDITKLKKYYLECHLLIKTKYPHLKLVIHDAFDLLGWNDFMIGNEYENVIIDTHLYLNFELLDKKEKTLDDYLDILNHKYKVQLKQASEYHNIIVGEWSLGNKLKKYNDRHEINALLYQKQIEIYETVKGWIFWNYKNLAEDRIEWDFDLIYQTVI